MKKLITLAFLALVFTSAFSQTPPTPVISSLGPTLTCNGSGVWLKSSASSGNHWSTGSKDTAIYVTQSGTFSVIQVIGTNTSMSSAPVTVSILPAATLVPVGPLCSNGNTVHLTGLPASVPNLSTSMVFNGPGISANTFNPKLANPGANNVIGLYVYYWTDTGACTDSSAIRINVVDCTALPDNEKTAETLLFPNPSQGSFNLANLKDDVAAISVFNSNGQEVPFLFFLKNEKAILQLEAPPGLYTLTLRRGNAVENLRLIKL